MLPEMISPSYSESIHTQSTQIHHQDYISNFEHKKRSWSNTVSVPSIQLSRILQKPYSFFKTLGHSIGYELWRGYSAEPIRHIYIVWGIPPTLRCTHHIVNVTTSLCYNISSRNSFHLYTSWAGVLTNSCCLLHLNNPSHRSNRSLVDNKRFQQWLPVI